MHHGPTEDEPGEHAAGHRIELVYDTALVVMRKQATPRIRREAGNFFQLLSQLHRVRCGIEIVTARSARMLGITGLTCR